MKNLLKRIEITLVSVLFLIFLLSSCQNDSSIQIEPIGICEETKLYSKILKIEPYHPKKILVRDSLLIVLNKEGKKYLEIFNLNSLTKTNEFISRGRGVNEMLRPDFCNFTYSNKCDLSIIFDSPRRRLYTIDLNKSFKYDSLVILEKKVLNNNLKSVSFVIYDNDSTIIISDSSGEIEGKFLIYNKKQEIKNITEYDDPKLSERINKTNNYVIFTTTSSAINETKGVIAITSVMSGLLCFYDMEGKHIKSVFFEDPQKLINEAAKPKLVRNLEITRHLTQLASINNKLYLLNTRHNYYGMEKSEILVFDWSGVIIKKYLLDKEIATFCIDKNEKYLYAYCPTEEIYSILKYQLR